MASLDSYLREEGRGNGVGRGRSTAVMQIAGCGSYVGTAIQTVSLRGQSGWAFVLFGAECQAFVFLPHSVITVAVTTWGWWWLGQVPAAEDQAGARSWCPLLTSLQGAGSSLLPHSPPEAGISPYSTFSFFSLSIFPLYWFSILLCDRTLNGSPFFLFVKRSGQCSMSVKSRKGALGQMAFDHQVIPQGVRSL